MAGRAQCAVTSIQYIQAACDRVGTTRSDEHENDDGLHLHLLANNAMCIHGKICPGT